MCPDRNGRVFRYILEYLRDGIVNTEALTERELFALKKEADYFALGGLISLLEDTSPSGKGKLLQRWDYTPGADTIHVYMVPKNGWYRITGAGAKAVDGDAKRGGRGIYSSYLFLLHLLWNSFGLRFYSLW